MFQLVARELRHERAIGIEGPGVFIKKFLPSAASLHARRVVARTQVCQPLFRLLRGALVELPQYLDFVRVGGCQRHRLGDLLKLPDRVLQLRRDRRADRLGVHQLLRVLGQLLYDGGLLRHGEQRRQHARRIGSHAGQKPRFGNFDGRHGRALGPRVDAIT